MIKRVETVKKAISRVTKPRVKKSVEKDQQLAENLQAQIELKAYQLFLARGCEHGHHVEDWKEAERIVKGV